MLICEMGELMSFEDLVKSSDEVRGKGVVDVAKVVLVASYKC